MPPRSLASVAAPAFSAAVRHRGERYFWNHRVTDLRMSDSAVRAHVIGTAVYNVELRLDDTRLRIECSCPQFVEHFTPCKHIWAVVLAADQRQAFTIPPGLWVDWPFGSDFETGYGVPKEAPPQWQVFLTHLKAPPSAALPPPLLAGELIYVLDVARSLASRALLVELMTRSRRRDGGWAKPKPLSLARTDVARLPDARDRRVLDLLGGAASNDPYGGGWAYTSGLPVPTVSALNLTLQREIMPQLCATERFFLRSAEQLKPIAWDPEPTEFVVRVSGSAEEGYTVAGVARSGGRERPLGDAVFVTGALVLWPPFDDAAPHRFAAFETQGAERWLGLLASTGGVRIPPSETNALAEALAVSGLQNVDCPDELRVTFIREAPRPVVRLSRAPRHHRHGRLHVRAAFLYGSREVDADSTEAAVVDFERRIAHRRDLDAEREALARLHALGVRQRLDDVRHRTRLECADTQLPRLVRTLVPEGWRVEAEGHVYRRATGFSLDVRSGVDWFELHGGVDFDDVSVPLPALLAAAKRKEGFVALGDGTFGLLPEEWLARSGRIAAMGTAEGDHVRFAPSQAALLDAWLATEPSVRVDEAFARAREALATFEGIAPVDPPPSFHGALRDYQRDALGWFAFLRRFGFGGCLADEMGLGKTVMVLAALEERRVAHAGADGRAPSLIVVPRSLVFNWRHEAERFAPGLRVLDYTGSGRREALAAFSDYDVVLTTYGTLRRDAGELKDVLFDYVILDEAQAIKNPGTNAAKAARLLKGRHRLALSGTPVENHLGELWSLFDFLNPGILGVSATFASAGWTGTDADAESLSLLARALRPFILRRTKEQVASELPPRTEQTIYCDLEPAQRRFYDDLREHYRAALLGAVTRQGIGRSKLLILEALLRLRQAACHPGLVEHDRVDDPSAKLDMLVERLQELVEDGRKALVFSQFTSLLALVRPRLEQERIAYEYLDGRTRDRAARVARFQEGACPIFLISLKAGGLGLNLTAADYVFLLDPWWNPAVEAQAIDRTHRIGQTRPVFAFRLIARDTVEEKVLELQAGKRRLADAIVRADGGLIRDLKREDLDLLLS